jgi:hypothetical protein
MSYFVCPETGAHHEIFGKSNPERMAAEFGIPFLGCLPIDPTLASLCDRGKIESYPGDLFGPIAQKIIELAPVARAPKSPGAAPRA